MDVFVEYMVRKQKSMKDTFIIIGTVIGVLIVGFIALGLLGGLGPVAALLIGYCGYLIITSRSVEYEYSVTNGELDVDKIIAQRKRKRLLSIHVKEFEIVAPVNDERYRKEFENIDIKKTIDASSTVKSQNVYFAVFTLNGEKCRLIFEPTQKMLDAFKAFIPRNVFEK